MATRSWLISSPRSETLPARPHLRVQLVGGAVEVVAHDAEDVALEVLDVTGNPVEVTVEDTLLSIGYPSLGWEGWMKRLTSFRSSDRAGIRLAVPRGTGVTLATATAAVTATGLTADVSLYSAAGIVYAADIRGKVTARTFSGAITLDRHEGPVTVQSASGIVRIQGSTTHVGVSTGSGDVQLRNASTSSVVSVSTLAGAVDVLLPPTGLVLTARTVSGAVDVDGASRRTSSGPAVVAVDERSGSDACWLTVNTVSGAVRVQRAGSDST